MTLEMEDQNDNKQNGVVLSIRIKEVFDVLHGERKKIPLLSSVNHFVVWGMKNE